MAQWRLRPLGDFPPSFREALLQGEGQDKIAGVYMTKSGAVYGQTMFRLFRYCVRCSPSAVVENRMESAFYHRTRIAWDGAAVRWMLYLTSKKSALSLHENPKVLE